MTSDTFRTLVTSGSFVDRLKAPSREGAFSFAPCCGKSLIIDGRQVTGMTTRLFGSEGNWRGEFTILDVNDELEIHYGSAGNSTHEEFLAAQETISQIITSFRLD